MEMKITSCCMRGLYLRCIALSPLLAEMSHQSAVAFTPTRPQCCYKCRVSAYRARICQNHRIGLTESAAPAVPRSQLGKVGTVGTRHVGIDPTPPVSAALMRMFPPQSVCLMCVCSSRANHQITAYICSYFMFIYLYIIMQPFTRVFRWSLVSPVSRISYTTASITITAQLCVALHVYTRLGQKPCDPRADAEYSPPRSPQRERERERERESE